MHPSSSMASSFSFYLLFFIYSLTFLHPSSQEKHTSASTEHYSSALSFSFPLTSSPLSNNPSYSNSNYLSTAKNDLPVVVQSYDYRSSFKYSMALVVSLPIGTPPQNQKIVLDTGSQLSWIHCHDKTPAPRKQPPPPPPTTAFDPSLSSTFSVLPCTHPLCKPRIPDFSLPTSCDQNRLCHYSYFYADGTLAEGNLVREKFTFSNSQSTPPLILGCATGSTEDNGILGMNLGRLSFASQAKLQKFSYCVPFRQGPSTQMPTGAFYLGQNPNSQIFKYINLLTFPDSQRSPNFDTLAYTVGLTGIHIGGKRLNISESVFRPDANGSGQTIIDSGTQYTFLVEEAYNKVREEVVKLTGPKLKNDYVYGGSLDMCFDENPTVIGGLIGDMVLEFEKDVQILVNNERIIDDVGGGVHCLGIGRSDSLGVASNIIGNFHQQNQWIEFDLVNRRVGFSPADCSRSV